MPHPKMVCHIPVGQKLKEKIDFEETGHFANLEDISNFS